MPDREDGDMASNAPGNRAGLVAATGVVVRTVFFSMLLVFAVELVARGSLSATLSFFSQPLRPSWATVLLVSALALALDALLGRAHKSFLIIAPMFLVLAWVCSQKAYYLGDPLYPTDILFARQIFSLLPLLVHDRPFTALAALVGAFVVVALLIWGWRLWRHGPRLTWKARTARLLIALPVLAFFVSIMDYSSFSWVRDRLQIVPVMWDQKENYASNGFALAFALNLPMAKVEAPKGYSEEAIRRIADSVDPTISAPPDKPDIIMVMSESFWDPTLLPQVAITPDPIPTVRRLRSGSMLSPQFGGMTANVEFEAVSGFSNAFLPYGSIPYQQYVRRPVPSLASFLRSQGYLTRAIHPFEGWFWNRETVYPEFGFDAFYSSEKLPPLEKRGPLVSDAALTEEIISQADAIREPFFFFAVTLQGHGPYEPNRYADITHKVAAPVSEPTRQSILTYSEGASDADKSLARLIDWAKSRKRKTIVVFFGDHLPPLGPVYTETGFMKEQVPNPREEAEAMKLHHDTPLVVWSSDKGALKDLGSVSPSFLPTQILKTAGFRHPYYTGLLGALHDRYGVIERHLLIDARGDATSDWLTAKQMDPQLGDLRLLQYDMMFGSSFATDRLFPEMRIHTPAG